MGLLDKIDFNKRETEMASLARSLNVPFAPVDDDGIIQLLKSFNIYSKWVHKQKIKNIIRLDDAFLETRLLIFDYIITKQANNSRILDYQTVYFIQSKKIGLPEILLQPENLFQKIAIFFGGQDINFTSHPEFSKNYRLVGDSELVSAAFNYDILNFFTIEKDWTMEALNYYLLFYKKNKLIDTQVIKSDIVKLTNLLKYMESENLEITDENLMSKD